MEHMKDWINVLKEAQEQTEKIAEEAECNMKYLEADNNDVSSYLYIYAYIL